MPERWRVKLHVLGRVEPTPGLFERANAGPVRSPPKGGAYRVLTAAVVLGLVLSGLGLLWLRRGAELTTDLASDRPQESPNGLASPAPPGPARAPAGEWLRAVAASAPDNVWAVGSAWKEDGSEHSLVLHWGGDLWARVPSPDVGMLVDVAAISPDAAWAVGGNSVLRWDGKAWLTIHPPLPPGASLRAVEAVSRNELWIVGSRRGEVDDDSTSDHEPLLLHFDDSGWHMIGAPSANEGSQFLHGVVALSPSDVWAAGYVDSQVDRTLVLHGNQDEWSRVESPNPGSDQNVIWGVGTDRKGTLWAVGHWGDGDNQEPLAMWRNGGAWVQTPMPVRIRWSPTALDGVSEDDVWLVGGEPNSSHGIAHWNGQMWDSVNNQGASGTLVDVAAVEANTVWAVGYQTAPNSELRALIERWNGERWDMVPVPVA